MSRGPGRWQRAIIAAVEVNPTMPVILTRPENSHAEQNAIRRAARQLEAAGRVKVVSVEIDGTSRLAAFSPDAGVADRVVVGLDGKTYHTPR